MIRVEPFQPEHLLEIEAQPAQSDKLDAYQLMELGRAQSARGLTFTARDAATDRILICGGAAFVNDNYASLWAVLSLGKGTNMQLVTRRVRAFIRDLPHRRVDTTIHSDFAAAIRWAGMIGLAYETKLSQAMPDGGDALIFRRGA